MISKLIKATLVLSLGVGTVGCASNAETGALLGGLGGAGIGAAIGSHSHGRAGEGALIGGAVGALGGALVGSDADRRERERAGRYYDDYDYGRPRGGTYYREREYGYYDRAPRRHYHDGDGYYEYRSYRSYGGHGGRRTYYESRRYYDDCD